MIKFVLNFKYSYMSKEAPRGDPFSGILPPTKHSAVFILGKEHSQTILPLVVVVFSPDPKSLEIAKVNISAEKYSRIAKNSILPVYQKGLNLHTDNPIYRISHSDNSDNKTVETVVRFLRVAGIDSITAEEMAHNYLKSGDSFSFINTVAAGYDGYYFVGFSLRHKKEKFHTIVLAIGRIIE